MIMHIPYSTHFTYQNNELTHILQNSLELLFYHSKLPNFNSNSLYPFENTNSKYLTCDCMLSASANYYSDEMSDKDCSKLNNHFHALKIKAKERYNYLTQKLLIDAQALNWAPYDADKQNQVYKDQIELENFAKNHQFFYGLK